MGDGRWEIGYRMSDMGGWIWFFGGSIVGDILGRMGTLRGLTYDERAIDRTDAGGGCGVGG
ncbi:MAG: hypothetical protein RI897_3636 [Verrucomicrobiota bacterium]